MGAPADGSGPARRHRRLAWAVLAAALVSMAMGAGLAGSALGTAFGLIGPPLLLPAYLLHRHARRLGSADAGDVLATHPNGFVLLLRCFTVDDLARLGEAGLAPGFEERLVELLRPIGPVVAVGRPGETLPPLGAARLHLTTATWQDEVGRLMRQARAVVLVLFAPQAPQADDQATGLRWEIEQALTTVAPQRLLMVLPAAMQLSPSGLWRRARKRRDRRRAFQTLATAVLQVAPEPIAGLDRSTPFLRFGPDGVPQALSTRRLGLATMRFAAALRPFYDGLGVPAPHALTWLRPGRLSPWTRFTLLAVLVIWLAHGLRLLLTG